MVKLIKKEKPKKPFPKLMKHKYIDFYVWFEEESTGFIDHISYIDYSRDFVKGFNINSIKRGFMSLSWDMGDFKDTDDTINNVLQKRKTKKTKRKPFPKLKKHKDELLDLYVLFGCNLKSILSYCENNDSIAFCYDTYDVDDFKDTDDELIFNFQGRSKTDDNSINDCLDPYNDDLEEDL